MKTKYIITLIISCNILVCAYFTLKYIFPNAKVFMVNTTVDIEKDKFYLGRFSSFSTKYISFQLKNSGQKPLIIKTVKTACGCTVAHYDKNPIEHGQTTKVVLEYRPDALGYFRKTADVVCNVPDGFVQLTISGEIVNNL